MNYYGWKLLKKKPKKRFKRTPHQPINQAPKTKHLVFSIKKSMRLEGEKNEASKLNGH